MSAKTVTKNQSVKKIEDRIEKQIAKDVVRKNKRPTRKSDGNEKTTENRAFATVMSRKMSMVEAETLKGVHTYLNPWTKNPRGVPAGRPANIAVTEYTVKASIAMQTNSSGFLAFNICPPDWVPDASAILPQPDTSSRLFALTQGYPVWWTSPTYPSTNIPPAGVSAGSTNIAWQFPANIVPGILAQNYIRCDGCGFSVFPESPAQTTQGDIMVYRFKDLNRAGAAGFNANSISKDALAAMDESMVTTEERSLAGWKSGTAMHLAVLPSSMCAELYTPVPATGYALSPLAYAGFVITGAAANQSVVVEWVFQMSCTNVVSYRADDNVIRAPPISTPVGSGPRAAIMEHYSNPKVMKMNSENGGEAAKVMLHDKKEKEVLSKAESKSWLQSAVDWGFENVGPIVSTVAEVGSVLAALL